MKYGWRQDTLPLPGNFHSSFSDWDELIFNIREIVVNFDLIDFFGWGFNFAPSIDFKSQMLTDNIGVGIANSDYATFLDNIELLILSEKHNCSILISNNNLSLSNFGSIISSSLFVDVYWVYLLQANYQNMISQI